MTGGEAFFLANADEISDRLGPTDLRPHPLDGAAADRLKAMLEEHVAATGSQRAGELLAGWPVTASWFVQLAPGPAPAPSRPAEPAEPAVSVPSPR
jgi:glutamate synthase domain-containing protein 3